MNKLLYWLLCYLGALLFVNQLHAQSVYVTSSGGNFETEKWMSITTGINGTGTQVWGQGDGTYGNGQGVLSDVEVDLSAYCGQTLYINAYDRYDDGWDGTTYVIYDAAGESGNLLASNGGASPNSGEDDDCNTSSWCTTDPSSELETSEAFTVPACPCTFPTATYTVVPDCGNGQFSIDVDVTSLGDATGVDITDGTTTYQTNVSTGTYTIGPFSAGTNQTAYVEGTSYSGCDINSTTLTEACVCSNAPVATTAGTNLDCGASTYDIEVTVTDFGDGTAADIWIDGSLQQSSAALSTLYTFTGYASGSHTVTIKATGGAFVTCETDYAVSETCNGSNLCSGAPDVTNTCQSGDLSVATADGGALIENYISCGNGNTIALCGANASFTGSSYSRTDHADIWYQVSPNGANQVTIDISNLTGGNLMILPYLTNGTCPSTTTDNTTLEGHIGNSGITGGSCPYFSGDGSLVLSGADVATASVIYLRIMAYANNGSGATNCETLTYPTFDICTTVPQANDICSDAIDIDGVSSTGNFCQANTDAENAETCDVGSGCNACTIASETEDLWYSVTMDPGDADQNLEVDITFTNATDAVVVTLYSGCFSNSQMDVSGVADCATVSSTGAGSTVTHQFSSTITEGGSGPDWYIRVAPVSGNSICSFDIEARRVAENNDCAHFQNVFPGFDIETAQTVDFNYSTDSGSSPVTAGSDLWYQFDPNSGTDNGIPVYSTKADVAVSGLGAGEEITVLLYEANTVSANNCLNLSSDYLTSITITADGTETIHCLNEIHGPADGGYLVRIVQSAGGATATPTVTITPSAQVGKYNNSCVNVWDGTSPINLGVSDAAHEYNAYYILDGETITGDFTGTTDCDSEIASSTCSGTSNDPFSDADERDLWYVFKVPSSSCPSLTTSTVISSMDITYDASNAFRDARLYVYSDCGDADLIDCSPTLDGAGETWTVSGLTKGEYYLIRVKPSSLNSDFDYSFDLTLNNGAVRPCNNEGSGAESLSVNSCNDYSGLTTYSMKGADESAGTGVPENDVWFTFTAPSPANGGSYFNANKSWVTIFLENVSGTSAGPLSIQLYDAPTSILATATTYSTTSVAGSQTFAHFGHLEPGQTYYLRVYHKETETATVDYKINAYTPNANETDWQCGNNNSSLVTGCSEGCNDLREAYFKIDLPEGTPSNQYYMIEVVGQDQILDFELRSQYLTESSATEGDYDDYDHPCSSRPLEAGVSIASETYGVTSPTTGESCDTNADAADGGEGVRRVYYGMNGPASGMKDYYYIKVFMDPSDPNYASSTGLKICTINFNGPYSTQALAEAGGMIDVSCSAFLAVELSSFKGTPVGEDTHISWTTETETDNSHFVLEHSNDGVVFSELTTVEGSGTTLNTQYYSFDHRNAGEMAYYRLKQFDFDGEVSLSDVIFVERNYKGVKVFPNPAIRGENITISSDELITGLEIRNSLGATILKREEIHTKGMVIDDIREPGVYFIVVCIGSQNVIRKVVLQ